MLLSDLLDDIRSFVRRYVILSDAQADAITLWTAHTHVLEVAEATPYLSVNSAERRSGKTRILEVLELLVARPWLTGRISAAALVRKIDKDHPTLLLDESDTAFKGEKDYAEALRGILNSGYRLSGKASLCVGQGANFTVRDFSTFCPKAIAGIGHLPDTVSDRSISIRLKRRAPGEKVERFRLKVATQQAEPVKRNLEAFAKAALPLLKDAEPELPDELSDRAADVWEPLIAIADRAGGVEWPLRARNAALEISAGQAAEDGSTGVQLLADIERVFLRDPSRDRISSAELVSSLNAFEDSPWGDWNHGKGLTVRRLAALLKPYGIKPKRIRFGESSLHGYYEEPFRDAWSRYLPLSAHSDRNKRNIGSTMRISEQFGTGTEPSLFPFGNGDFPLNHADVPVVPLQTRVTDEDLRRVLEMHRPELVGRDDITTMQERRSIAQLELLISRASSANGDQGFPAAA